MLPTRHELVPVKVNAWVDAGVAPLVEALSLHPGVVTIDSCQGDGDRFPYVLFTARDDLDKVVRELARVLGPQLVGTWRACLKVERHPAAEFPMAELQVAPGWVEHVADTLSARLGAVVS